MGEEYEPSVSEPDIDPNRDPDDPDGDGGENGNGDEDGGDGIDQTGTLLSEQYSARDAIQQAAKGTTQATILLFGVVVAGIALFEEAIRDIGQIRLYLPLGVGLFALISALFPSSYVLIRTAGIPRPSTELLSDTHEEINNAILPNTESRQSQGEKSDSYQDLSQDYFSEIKSIQKSNENLGVLIAITVSLATIGTILGFYGVLVLVFEVSLTQSIVEEWWIAWDTLIVVVILVLVTLGLSAHALKRWPA